MPRYLPQLEHWLELYGKWTLFFENFLAGIRHFTALAAGMSNVRVGTFARYAFPGGFVWVASFISIGYFLGAEWEQLRQRFDRGGLIVLGVIAAAALLGWRLRARNIRN